MKALKGNPIAVIKLGAILLLTLVAIHPLLRSTLPWSDDGQLHFWRVVELDHSLRNGYFFPRWMPDMAFGYGYPLLNYYAPLSVYLAEGFHLLGLSFTPALLAALSASLALGALGAFLWAREAFDEAGGVLTAVAFAYAPYTLYNAIWRGNLAEALALGILPWAFWRLRRLALERTWRNLTLAALVLALLVLSHNITALIAVPLLVGYALILWLTTGRPPQALALMVGALALGLALAAFFWLPAFFEREFAQTAKMITTSHFDYRHNFLEPGELLSPPVPVDVTLMNPPVPRSLAWPVLVLAMAGVIGGWRVRRLDNRKYGNLEDRKNGAGLPTLPHSSLFGEIAFLLVALLLFAFLTLPVSQFLWASVPLLPYIGFPWRFLGPAGLMAAWLAGASVRWIERWPSTTRTLGVGLTVLVTLAFALTWLYPRYLEPIENTTPAGLIAFEQDSGALGTTSVGEYLPVWVAELPDTRALEAQYQTGGSIQRLTMDSLPERASIVSEAWRLVGGDVTVNSPQEWTATLLLFYFPGWRVWLNGTEVDVIPSQPHGLLRFPVPSGETHIKVRFGSTPWRSVGTLLSIVSLLALAVLFFRDRSSRTAMTLRTTASHGPSVWFSALVVVGLFGAVKAIYLDTHDSLVRYAGFDGQTIASLEAPVQVHLDEGIRLLGHDPAAPTVEAGGALSLRLYWTAAAPLDEEYSSFLHLVDDEGHLWGQSDNQHPGGYPTVRWRPGEYNCDVHALVVWPGTPPDDYILRAGLVAHTTGVGLDVLDERGAPAGKSVTLGTLAVTPSQQPLPVEALDMAYRLDIEFGDLTLLGMDLDRHQAAPGERLLLRLYWQARQTPHEDYAASVHLLDGLGHLVAEVALPLASASYLPTRWSAGEVVLGQHWLTLPVDLDSSLLALRLQLLGSNGVPIGEPVSLGKGGQVTVVAPERQTVIPPIQHQQKANFGDRATLLGYDLEPAVGRPGETLRLTLYWRAEQSMARNYAVFAHLLDAESRIVAQHDAVPANWTRPTTGWLPGEVVTDSHELALDADTPPGEYLLEVGLYEEQTATRLPVLDGAGQTVGDRLLLEAVKVEP